MRVLLWAVTAVTALFWTVGAWVATQVLGWAADLTSSGNAADPAGIVAGWSLPAWVAGWIDPGVLGAAFGALVWSLEQARDVGPWLGTALGWLVPLTWIVWGLGLAALIALTLFVQWLICRVQTPAARGA